MVDQDLLRGCYRAILDLMDCIAIHDAFGIDQNFAQKTLFTNTPDSIRIRGLSYSRPVDCAGLGSLLTSKWHALTAGAALAALLIRTLIGVTGRARGE
ncbi:hypothetical protein T31B1_17858 [Salinisphaera sp. T31B1]